MLGMDEYSVRTVKIPVVEVLKECLRKASTVHDGKYHNEVFINHHGAGSWVPQAVCVNDSFMND